MKSTTLKAFFITFIIILSFGGLSIYIAKKSKSNAENKNIVEKLLMVKKVRSKIDSVALGSKIEDNVMNHIVVLLDDYYHHKKVGEKLSYFDIQEIEQNLNLAFPQSYVLFLQYFGNGAKSIYQNNITNIKKPLFLSHYFKELDEVIKNENGEEFYANTLLCLTKKDSNNGIWCWLTEDDSENGEWPVAYYNGNDNTLYYETENFTQWLDILIKNKAEVIQVLDIENKLHLKPANATN